MKWPKYVRIQRQRRVLNQRLKVGGWGTRWGRVAARVGRAAGPEDPCSSDSGATAVASGRQCCLSLLVAHGRRPQAWQPCRVRCSASKQPECQHTCQQSLGQGSQQQAAQQLAAAALEMAAWSGTAQRGEQGRLAATSGVPTQLAASMQLASAQMTAWLDGWTAQRLASQWNAACELHAVQSMKRSVRAQALVAKRQLRARSRHPPTGRLAHCSSGSTVHSKECRGSSIRRPYRGQAQQPACQPGAGNLSPARAAWACPPGTPAAASPAQSSCRLEP